MAIIDRAKKQPAHEIIGSVIGVDPDEIKANRYEADNYNRPPVFSVNGNLYCAPPDNLPPYDRKWTSIGETNRRTVYVIYGNRGNVDG